MFTNKTQLREYAFDCLRFARLWALAQNGYKPLTYKVLSSRMITKPDVANLSRAFSGACIPTLTTFVDLVQACNCELLIVPKDFNELRNCTLDFLINKK